MRTGSFALYCDDHFNFVRAILSSFCVYIRFFFILREANRSRCYGTDSVKEILYKDLDQEIFYRELLQRS